MGLLLHCHALPPQGERPRTRHARTSTGIGMGKTPCVVRVSRCVIIRNRNGKPHFEATSPFLGTTTHKSNYIHIKPRQ